MDFFYDIAAHEGIREGKHFKATLAQSPRLLLGLNCLEPGQSQAVHEHGDQDKFYCVVRGTGVFHVGAADREAEAGTVIWAPAGTPHGVRNASRERLVLLVGIAPAPPGR